MKVPPPTLSDRRRAIQAVRVLGESALPILRRIVDELDRREADRRLLRLVEEDATGPQAHAED